MLVSRKIYLLDNHLYSIFSIIPDSIFYIPSLTPLFSSSITFSFLIVIRLRHTINANAISVDTPLYIYRTIVSQHYIIKVKLHLETYLI